MTVGGGLLADTKLEVNAGGDQYAALRIKNSQGSWNWQVTPSADPPGGRLRLADETTGKEYLAINHDGVLTIYGNRTILDLRTGFDGPRDPNGIPIDGFHWFGPVPDSDLAFGIQRIAANNYNFNVLGTVFTRTLIITGGSDLAEHFAVRSSVDVGRASAASAVQAGQVVSIDPDEPGKLVLSSQAYDRKVAGIISGAGGVRPGMLMSQSGSAADGDHPIALTGRVYCWADASYGPIAPGDLLTTSDTPGHAMKVTDYAKARGAVLGKAMAALKEGKGLVLALVTLQ